MRQAMFMSVVSGAFALLTACDGGGGLVGEAEKLAEEACACEDVGCARGKVSDLNKISVQRSEEVDALSEEDKAKFSAANEKASACRDKLDSGE